MQQIFFGFYIFFNKDFYVIPCDTINLSYLSAGSDRLYNRQ